MNVLIACEESQRVCKAFRDKGHNAFSCDIQECSGGHPEWHIQGDVLPLLNGGDYFFKTADGKQQYIEKWDLIIAHPPCTRLCTTSQRWLYFGDKEYRSKKIAEQQKAIVFFMMFALADCERIAIENPRGGMRKMDFMKDLPRYTVTYCQYGERRMKPTDIWTNHPNPQFKPPCKNGDTCHDAAPRGSKKGTQALKNAKEKGVIPKALCQHIVDICEKYIN